MSEPRRPKKEILCKTCKTPMVIKASKYGEFLSCGNYPTCKTTRPLSLDVPCPQPECNGEIVERKSKKGKTFYSCIEYPDCQFIIWDKPSPESCPECDHPFMLVKMALWESLVCPAKECGHTNLITFSGNSKSKE